LKKFMSPIIIIFLIVACTIIVTVVAIRIVTPEDTWICKSDVWVQHGNPINPPPTLKCD